MTRKHFLVNIVAAASALWAPARRGDAASGKAPAEKPFSLKLSIDNGKFTQEVAVAESDRFEVVTRFDNRRWTVKGRPAASRTTRSPSN